MNGRRSLIGISIRHVGVCTAAVSLFVSSALAAEETARRSLATEAVISHPEQNGHVHGSHPECPIPKAPQDVVDCAKGNHPSVRRSLLTVERSRTLTDVASQLSNPELDVETAFGRGDSSSSSETQIGILQQIPLGGKRAARKGLAAAEQKEAQATLGEHQAEIIIETIRHLHRLRQLLTEKRILLESSGTLSKLISQQRSRPALAPEQQVSLSVFQMALADTKLRQAELFEEERSLEHFFHVSTGHSLTEISASLPPAPEKWPQINENSESRALSPAAARSAAERELAFAEVSAAHAESWPSLRVGPLLGLNQEAGRNETLFGVRLMMDLPVFQTNGAGRKHAAAGLRRSEKLVELVRAEEDHERAEKVRTYRNAVEALKTAPSLGDMEKMHLRNEGLARRGLISASLLIESHRQRNELIKSLHGRELSAIEALWQIYKLDGRINEESL